jgi:hypothetical protein
MHVQAGTPLFALQEMGGWSSAEMMRRYAHLAAVGIAFSASVIAADAEGDAREAHGMLRHAQGPHQ